MSQVGNACQRLVSSGLPDPSDATQKAQYLLDWITSVTESLECTALEVALTGVCENACVEAVHDSELVTIEACRTCLLDNVPGCLFPDTAQCLECFIDHSFPFKPDTNDQDVVNSILENCFEISTGNHGSVTATQLALLIVFSVLILTVSGLLAWVSLAAPGT